MLISKIDVKRLCPRCYVLLEETLSVCSWLETLHFSLYNLHYVDLRGNVKQKPILFNKKWQAGSA